LNFYRKIKTYFLNKKQEEYQMENKMFCYQCQETAGCSGCTQVGVCGKTPETANLQDLLIYVTKGLSEVTTRLRAEGKAVSHDINQLVTENLFVTITNANFDPDFIIDRIQTTLNRKAELLGQLKDREGLSEAALWNADKQEFAAKSF